MVPFRYAIKHFARTNEEKQKLLEEKEAVETEIMVLRSYKDSYSNEPSLHSSGSTSLSFSLERESSITVDKAVTIEHELQYHREPTIECQPDEMNQVETDRTESLKQVSTSVSSELIESIKDVVDHSNQQEFGHTLDQPIDSAIEQSSDIIPVATEMSAQPRRPINVPLEAPLWPPEQRQTKNSKSASIVEEIDDRRELCLDLRYLYPPSPLTPQYDTEEQSLKNMITAHRNSASKGEFFSSH